MHKGRGQVTADWERWVPTVLHVGMVLGVVGAAFQYGFGAREIVGTAIFGVGAVLHVAARHHAAIPTLAFELAGAVVLGLGRPGSMAWGLVILMICRVAGDHGLAPAAPLTFGVCGFYMIEKIVQDDPAWLTWIAGTLLACGGGAMVHKYRGVAVELQESQAQLASKAAAEERQRIAGEVHDVIAHSLAVMMLHVSGARLAVENEPEEAVAALTEAERLGREALQELRRTVGLLGQNSKSAPNRPQPGMSSINGLIDEYRATGMPIDLEAEGDLSAVAPTIGLTAYRIVQEALANAARHAPGSAVVVELRVANVLTICVTNGRGIRLPSDGGTGLGLAGLGDRARVVGGKVEAAPFHDGWRVEAVLPLAAIHA